MINNSHHLYHAKKWKSCTLNNCSTRDHWLIGQHNMFLCALYIQVSIYSRIHLCARVFFIILSQSTMKHLLTHSEFRAVASIVPLDVLTAASTHRKIRHSCRLNYGAWIHKIDRRGTYFKILLYIIIHHELVEKRRVVGHHVNCVWTHIHALCIASNVQFKLISMCLYY